jgi:hypothetical protein
MPGGSKSLGESVSKWATQKIHMERFNFKLDGVEVKIYFHVNSQIGLQLWKTWIIKWTSIAFEKEQVLLVICELKKFYFILIWSTNLDWFQSIALALLWIAYWPIERGEEMGE